MTVQVLPNLTCQDSSTSPGEFSVGTMLGRQSCTESSTSVRNSASRSKVGPCDVGSYWQATRTV